MKLKNLFSRFGKMEWRKTSPELEVSGIFSDSRRIQPGTVFVAVQGVSSNGHDYIPKAIEQGAVALVVEKTDRIPKEYTGAVLQVLESQMVYTELLREFYAQPEEKLTAIAVTGTNGKTSTSYMIEAILNEAGLPCGVMGTIDHHFKNQTWKSDLTTPDTASFFKRLHEFVEAGAKAFVMEVSSHALKQKRVAVEFDAAVYTNFTRDHLDYHLTMEDYWQSKEKLFSEYLKKDGEVFAIINSDDPQVDMVRVMKSAQRLTFGKNGSENDQDGSPDFQFVIKKSDLRGISFVVHEKGLEKSGGDFEYSTSMIGEHNIYNWVGAIALSRALGATHGHCQLAVKRFMGVPGRLERVPGNRNIFVDYAHTPDALEKVLLTLSALKTSGGATAQLVTIFGCGGDRDKGKRPLMGQMAEKFSDQIIVTSDNPRSENPESIIDDIFSGLKKPGAWRVTDRESAFKKALEITKPGDVILIAGKGHEDYQIIGDKTLSFSDVLVMKQLLKLEK